MKSFQIKHKIRAMESVQMLVIRDENFRQYFWDGATLYRATPIKGTKPGRKPKK